MLIVQKRAFARIGLLGNPSDGFNGKTISFVLRNFWAEVVLYEWDSVDIVLAAQDRASFQSVRDLADDVRMHGYYGGIRLIKATIKRFVDYCDLKEIELHDRNFSVRYTSNVPLQVGLAGSSAIIVATLRALMVYYDVEIPRQVQASLVLSVETDELGIGAGLQDRVIQCYEGLVSMNFAKSQEQTIDGLRCYAYEPMDPAHLPPLYVAYHRELSEPTEIFHNDIRSRYRRGDTEVIGAMDKFADLAALGRAALLAGDQAQLGKLIDANFDLRCTLYQLPHWQTRMVETARACGATGKFAGSGGAIVGTYTDEAMYDRLVDALGQVGSIVIKPQIIVA